MRRKTTEEFVADARKVHGDRYGYEKASYEGAIKKVTITCPVHGDFEQTPDKHLGGNGCRECRDASRRLDTESFIKRAVAVHGERYSYDKVVYIGGKKKVTITCPVHGDFEQRAINHLCGQGCLKCRYDAQHSDTESFVKRAVEVHGGRYSYDKVVYASARHKVTITCPVHGDFEQRASIHLQGSGCLKCSDASRRSDTQFFVKRAVQQHGEKYTYAKTVYTGVLDKVTITCPVHGDFEQVPSSHMRGHGCPKCAGRECSDTESFVKRAVEVHGDRYGYEKIVYMRSSKKVTITCPVHGDFQQVPGNHLQGQGCPKCQKQWSGDGIVYVMCSPEGYNKIGIAKSGKEHNRLSQILRSQQTKSPTAITGLSLVCAYSFNDGSFTEARRFESKAHRHFKERRKVFADKFAGSSEFFNVTVTEICQYLEQKGGKLVTIKGAP